MVLTAQALAEGDGAGRALVLAEPLSFWGGLDVETGRVIDRSHPDLGTVVSSRILVMPGARGSSSSSSVFAEAIRRGTGPAGIILAVADPILTVGALVAHSLYGLKCPVVVCPIAPFRNGQNVRVHVSKNGSAEVVIT